MPSGSITATKTYEGRGEVVQQIVIEWQSDAAGNVDQQTDFPINGVLHRVAFVPSESDQPTDAYDVTWKDENGIDVLRGLGENLSNTTPSDITPAHTISDGTDTAIYPTMLNDKMRLQVSGAGNGKRGQLVAYVR